MAKTIIMSATALVVLAAIVWMWRFDALSSGRDEEAQEPQIGEFDDIPPPDASARIQEPDKEPDMPERHNWPAELIFPNRIVLPVDAGLPVLVDRYYRTYDAGGRALPLPAGMRGAVVGKIARTNNLSDPGVVLTAGTEVFLPRIYVIAKNDTLTDIAQKFYGAPHTAKIFEANRDVIKDPDELRIGWVIIIP